MARKVALSVLSLELLQNALRQLEYDLPNELKQIEYVYSSLRFANDLVPCFINKEQDKSFAQVGKCKG